MGVDHTCTLYIFPFICDNESVYSCVYCRILLNFESFHVSLNNSCNNKWILFYFVDQVWRTVIEDKDLAKHIENKDQSNYIWSRVDYLPLNLFSSPEPKFLNKHCHSHCFHMASSFLNLFLFSATFRQFQPFFIYSFGKVFENDCMAMPLFKG